MAIQMVLSRNHDHRPSLRMAHMVAMDCIGDQWRATASPPESYAKGFDPRSSLTAYRHSLKVNLHKHRATEKMICFRARPIRRAQVWLCTLIKQSLAGRWRWHDWRRMRVDQYSFRPPKDYGQVSHVGKNIVFLVVLPNGHAKGLLINPRTVDGRNLAPPKEP